MNRRTDSTAATARQAAAAVALVLAGMVQAAEPAQASRPSAASTPIATNLALDATVEIALRDNADLQSMRARWEAMRERPAQASALPDPMLSYGAMGPWDNYRFPDSEEQRVGLEQEIPWFGKRALRGQIAEKDAAAMQRDYEAMRREVKMMAKEAYYDLYALEQVIAITRAQEELLKRMEQTAQTKYAAGSVEQQDVIKAQAEITMLSPRLIDLEQQRNVQRARLNRILNRPTDSFLGRPNTPPPDAAVPDMRVLLEEAERNRPEISAAQIRAEQASLDRRLMAKEYFPDVHLGVESRSFREGDDMVMAMIEIDLPVWWGKKRAGVREAEKMAESRRAGVEAARRQTAYDVQDACYKLVAARRTLELYRQALLPQAEARFAASEAGYRAGKADFLDLLESERFLLEVRVMTRMSEGSVGAQWARLERAVGAEGGYGRIEP
jgi:outer membrane protein TolC